VLALIQRVDVPRDVGRRHARGQGSGFVIVGRGSRRCEGHM
jgi:hypothetical protein